MISKFVNNICGIAMTLTDHASSVMSSQCLYIGMKAYPLNSKEGDLFSQRVCAFKIFSNGKPSSECLKRVDKEPGGRSYR